METNELNDLQLALEQGSALIEIMRRSRKSHQGASLNRRDRSKKSGLYRLDAIPLTSGIQWRSSGARETENPL